VCVCVCVCVDVCLGVCVCVFMHVYISLPSPLIDIHTHKHVTHTYTHTHIHTHTHTGKQTATNNTNVDAHREPFTFTDEILLEAIASHAGATIAKANAFAREVKAKNRNQALIQVRCLLLLCVLNVSRSNVDRETERQTER